MTVIWLEGADGSGKSSLAEVILEEFKRQRVSSKPKMLHYGVPSYDPDSPLTIGQQAMNQLLTPLLDYDARKDAIVIDRFHYGEPVYAPIFREAACIDTRFGTLTASEFHHVHSWLEEIRSVMIYVDGDVDVMMSRLEARGDEKVLSEDHDARWKELEQILERYNDIVAYGSRFQFTKPIFTCMNTPEDAQEVAEQAVTRAKHENLRLLKKLRTTNRLTNQEIVKKLQPKLLGV